MKMFWKLLIFGGRLILVLLILSTLYHIYQLKNEAKKYPPLWMRLTDNYKIAVVEKAGYGWSEKSSSSRDIDTII